MPRSQDQAIFVLTTDDNIIDCLTRGNKHIVHQRMMNIIMDNVSLHTYIHVHVGTAILHIYG